MRRPRHRSRSSARLSVSLLSLIALIALCCVPALAQAECTDSSCKQYEVEIPTAGGGEHKAKPHSGGQSESPAQASQAPKNKEQGSQPSEGKSEEEKSGATPGGGGNNGGNGPSANNGSSGSNGGNQPSTGLGDEKSLGTTQGQTASHSSGGSSPLVPILIAIAVLAAISIGAVIYRQRRQGSGGSGSPVSPKAG